MREQVNTLQERSALRLLADAIETETLEKLETPETSGVRRGFEVMRILKEVWLFVGCDV